MLHLLLNYYYRCCIIELCPQVLCRIVKLLLQVLYCWAITTCVLLKYYYRCCIYSWTITAGVVLLNYYRRCCIGELLPQVLHCWTTTTGVVLLNYYQKRCIVLLNYYHRCCIVLLNYYHRCCIVLLNYYNRWYIVLLNNYRRCRDVAGAALSSFSGPPPPSRTGLPPLTLLVTVSQSVNQSINQSINRFCLSVHPSIRVCIVTFVPHNRVYCFVGILPWILHYTLEPLPPMFIVLLNYYDLLYCWTITTGFALLNYYHRCHIVLSNYYHRCCCIVLLNYHRRCRDVAGAALFSFSGPPPPSRTGLPSLTLLVTVNQSIDRSAASQ